MIVAAAANALPAAVCGTTSPKPTVVIEIRTSHRVAQVAHLLAVLVRCVELGGVDGVREDEGEGDEEEEDDRHRVEEEPILEREVPPELCELQRRGAA